MVSISLERISDICAGYTGQGYFVEELIPDRKLRNATQSLRLPRDERIIAFVDGTVFGSGKNGLAICTNGLYWKNDWTTESRKTNLSWEAFAKCEVGNKGKFNIELGYGNLFNTSGCSFPNHQLIKLLQELQHYVSETLATTSGNAGPSLSGGSSDAWMLAIDGEQHGPYNLNVIQDMVRSKQIPSERTHVWKAGMPAWVPFVDQPDMAALLSPDASAAPPVPPPLPGSSPVAERGVLELFDQEAGEEEDGSMDNPVDVNWADEEELADLPGVGAIGAKRIVEERRTNGGFTSAEQLGEWLDLKPHHVVRLQKQAAFRPRQVKSGGARMVDF
ncbi:helix-hairpin-helix domain-containing protein [Paenibacillus daejeonensis]|uniref:helix-hairpin-helix domain-containing protein n=1 Tax=Paenibacillus daejeonensis TaxID=135193 RepID=UPI000362CCC8|nr:helix-hairpin-helix domain-containing protein [Paenibacillus daejeonensis]